MVIALINVRFREELMSHLGKTRKLRKIGAMPANFTKRKFQD